MVLGSAYVHLVTEPKIKFYFGVQDDSLQNSEQKLLTIKEDIMNRL